MILKKMSYVSSIVKVNPSTKSMSSIIREESLSCTSNSTRASMMQSALLFYRKLKMELMDYGFVVNRYDPCMTNLQTG